MSTLVTLTRTETITREQSITLDLETLSVDDRRAIERLIHITGDHMAPELDDDEVGNAFLFDPARAAERRVETVGSTEPGEVRAYYV